MRKRAKTSPIWTISKQRLEELAKKHDTYSSIIEELGLCHTNGGSRFRTLKDRLTQDGIDYSHIPMSVKGRKFQKEKIPLEEILVEKSTY